MSSKRAQTQRRSVIKDVKTFDKNQMRITLPLIDKPRDNDSDKRMNLEVHKMCRLTPVQWRESKSKENHWATSTYSPRDTHLHRDRGRLRVQTWNCQGQGSRLKKGSFTERGIYNKSVKGILDLITRENSVMLPPLETSRRVKSNVFDQRDVEEKVYVMGDFNKLGKMHKFSRDEVFIPTIYKEMFSCRECRLKYVSDKYMQAFSQRNGPTPVCRKLESAAANQAQFCDVLGRRFCHECGEAESREVGKCLISDLEAIATTDNGRSTPEVPEPHSPRVHIRAQELVLDNNRQIRLSPLDLRRSLVKNRSRESHRELGYNIASNQREIDMKSRSSSDQKRIGSYESRHSQKRMGSYESRHSHRSWNQSKSIVPKAVHSNYNESVIVIPSVSMEPTTPMSCYSDSFESDI